jgi:AraC-like DNA-binding protein
MQILPSNELQPFIKHYLFLESKGNGIKKLRLFSDGNTGMVFSFNNNLISITGNSEHLHYLPSSFVYGQISEFKDLYLVSEAALIVVVFQPAGINQLMGVSAAELRNNIINTEDLFGRNVLDIHTGLAEEGDFRNKVKMLNIFFAEFAAKTVLINQRLIAASINFILKNKGTNSVGQLVKYIGYTERQIERIFIECVGLSPKRFGSIVKLHSFLKLLKAKSNYDTLTALSCEAGYSDQSHLIKEFRKYTGVTPKEYLNKTNKLAINFMEINSTVHPMSGLYNLLKNP